jgi:hypothetical protein
MRYAPGKVPARPLPAAPTRPGVKQTVTGAPAQVPVGKPAPIPSSLINTRPRPAPTIQQPTRPGVRPMGPAPDKNLPFVINNKPIPGIRPPGTPTTGGGLPAPGMGGRPGLPMMKKGGKVSSASKRADGIAVKGKTKGRII